MLVEANRFELTTIEKGRKKGNGSVSSPVFTVELQWLEP